MRTIVRLAVLIIAMAAYASPQEYRPVELGLDYSYLHAQGPNGGDAVHMHGIQLSGTRNVNRRLGFGADFGAYYHCAAGCWGDTSLGRNDAYTLMAGPRLRLPSASRVIPFVAASGGMINLRYSEDFNVSMVGSGTVGPARNVSVTGGAFSVGGGLDYAAGRVAWRLFQVEYFNYPLALQRKSAVRFSAGIRIGLGRVR
ncbi:MAG: hypothetical protein ACR2IF_04815 [Terriglobales bacterium]